MFFTPIVCREAERAVVDVHVANYELWMAVQDGRPTLVDEMCTSGAQVNSQQPTSGLTAVMMASIYGHEDILDILIEGGADPDLQDSNGYTALMWAAIYGHRTVLNKLLAAGAKVDLQDSAGGTVLLWASGGGQFEIANAVVQHGATLDIRDEDGATALILAARFGHIKIVEMLLQHGAHISNVDQDRMNALDYAIEAGEEEIVDMLRMYNRELGFIAEESASRVKQEEEAHRKTELLANRYAYTASGINYNIAFKGDRLRKRAGTDNVVSAAEHAEHYEPPVGDPATRKLSVPVHELNPMMGERNRNDWENIGFFGAAQ